MLQRILCLLLFGIFALTACTTVGTKDVNSYLNPTEKLTPTVFLHRTSFLTEQFIKTSVPVVTITPQPTMNSQVTNTCVPATYYNFEPGVNPLTGLRVANPANLDRRPVLIKVSNWPRLGRPHAGLTAADIVFEYYIGHQMNRFLALYYGENADDVGPVRSGRLVDAQLTQLYQGILAYGNADPQVDEVLVEVLGERALAFNELPCPPMCGVLTHSATGVFADSGDMSAYAEETGIDNTKPDLRGMYFQEDPPKGDGEGDLVHIAYADFSVMEWRFNADTGIYDLWMEAETDKGLELAPMTDRNNDQPVSFENVVVMFAEYIEHAPTLHDIRIREATEYQAALLFRDGVVIYGTWRVTEPDRPIIFETPEGESLPFKPGKTWIVIVGMTSETVHPGKGEWVIYFGL